MAIKTNLKQIREGTMLHHFYTQARRNEKKILGDYQLCIIVGHHGWPTKKIFHFKLSETARKT